MLADAWEVEGRLRAGAARVRGLRLMASGIDTPQLNAADAFTGDADADIAAARTFFARRGVPWSLRVAEDVAWGTGREVARLRLMGVRANDLRRAVAPPGVTVRAATSADFEAVVAVDAAAFGGESPEARAWLEPHLHGGRMTVALAERDGEPLATAYAVRTDGDAGPAGYLAGVGVAPAARRQGIGAALSSWLLECAFASGAQLAALFTDTDEAARVYARLGFTHGGALRVFEDV